MRFICPKCGSIVVADDSLAGGQVLCGQCNAPVSVPPSNTSPGVVIADFVIEKEIGHGGMGTVFRAEQMSLERPVALKVLLPKFANDTAFVDQFIREARAAAKLNHPNIVQAYAVGEDSGLFYFAMELIEGPGTMKTELQKKKVIPVMEAAAIIRDVADALNFAWREARIVHHDIKPDNIMLTSSGRAKLADLGLAGVSGESDAGEDDNEVLGTPQYISPEQLTGEETDVRSDLYSLGATFYHLITGKPPFTGTSPNDIAKKHLEEALVPPEKILSTIPPAISQIICRMMEKEPEKRYQTAGEVSKALTRFLEENTPLSETLALKRLRRQKLNQPGEQLVSALSQKQPDPIEVKKRRQLWLIPIIVLSLAAGVAVAVLFFGEIKPDMDASRSRSETEAAAEGAAPENVTAGKPNSEQAAAEAPVPEKPAPPRDREEFFAQVRHLEQLYREKGGSPEFLAAGDAFFFGPLYPGITPNEQEASARVFGLYNRTDERVRMAPERRIRARRIQEEADRRRQEEIRRQEAENQKAAREQERKLALERQKQAAEARKKQDESKIREREAKYLQAVDEAMGEVAVAYADALRKPDPQILTKALADARKVIQIRYPDISSKEKARQYEALGFLASLERTSGAAQQAAVIFTGKEPLRYQFEVHDGELAKISGPGSEFGMLQAKSMLQDETVQLSLRDPDFRNRLTRLLSKRLPKVTGLLFYFDLADGAFSPEWIKDAPTDWWKKNASQFAKIYLRTVYAKASEAERATLRQRYSKLPEFQAVIR